MAEGGTREPVATVEADERIKVKIVYPDVLIYIFQNVGTHIFTYIIYFATSEHATIGSILPISAKNPYFT